MFEQDAGPNAVIRFYRAQGAYGFLSNLYRYPFWFEGRKWVAAEYAYQWGKPVSQDIAEWLVDAPRPHLCAAAAHALLRYDVRPDWSSVKQDRMRAILWAKFTQIESMGRRLVETGDAKLVEASTTDAFWGEGRKGDGHNMLGILLMGVRGRLAYALAQADGDWSSAVQVVSSTVPLVDTRPAWAAQGEVAVL